MADLADAGMEEVIAALVEGGYAAEECYHHGGGYSASRG